MADYTGGFYRTLIDGKKNLTKKHELDAGLDIYPSHGGMIEPGKRALIPCGIEVEIMPGYVGLILNRSGLSVKYGIQVGAGVIDATYRGELKVLLFNHGEKVFFYGADDRIAQMVTVPINLGLYTPTDQLSMTDRGTDGFGASGR